MSTLTISSTNYDALLAFANAAQDYEPGDADAKAKMAEAANKLKNALANDDAFVNDVQTASYLTDLMRQIEADVADDNYDDFPSSGELAGDFDLLGQLADRVKFLSDNGSDAGDSGANFGVVDIDQTFKLLMMLEHLARKGTKEMSFAEMSDQMKMAADAYAKGATAAAAAAQATTTNSAAQIAASLASAAAGSAGAVGTAFSGLTQRSVVKEVGRLTKGMDQMSSQVTNAKSAIDKIKSQIAKATEKSLDKTLTRAERKDARIEIRTLGKELKVAEGNLPALEANALQFNETSKIAIGKQETIGTLQRTKATGIETAFNGFNACTGSFTGSASNAAATDQLTHDLDQNTKEYLNVAANAAGTRYQIYSESATEISQTRQAVLDSLRQMLLSQNDLNSNIARNSC
jgi:hypothetical protein